MGYIIVIVIFTLVVVSLLGITTWTLTNVILKPKTWSPDYIYKEEVSRGRLDEEFYKYISKEEFHLNSSYGYQLSGMILSNEETDKPENSQKVAVLCHGYTWGKYGAIVYAQMLMELGFTCVIYDHRNHGESNKAYTTMGYYEKFDLKTVIDFCYERFGNDIKVITHGESMGAATVLNHLAIDDRIACVIADCAFSDLRELLKFQLKNFYHLPVGIFLFIANIIFKLRAGFWIKEVSPKEGAVHSEVPILFIHGDEDNYVPTIMSENMYETRTGVREIYICKGARHAESCTIDPVKYRQVIIKFLDKYYV